MYGVLQVVIRKTELLKGIVKEMCLSIEDLLRKEMKRLTIQRFLQELLNWKRSRSQYLARYTVSFLFEIMTSKETREDIRLKYRYLDLRNAKVKDNIIFRSQVISFLRQKMTEMGFLEIQTPILCASSPEGARDYIVPSRKYKGKFMHCLRLHSSISSC